MTTLAPSGPLRHVAARCEKQLAGVPQLSAQDLLEFMNEGYARACERARLIDEWTTLTVAAGDEAVALPAELVKLLDVFSAGEQLVDVGFQRALRAVEGFYYWQGAQRLHLPRAVETDTEVVVHYVTRPDPLTSLDSPLHPAFGWEFLYLLVSWCKYRIGLVGGGAGDASYTIAKRQEYDAGVTELRTAADTFRSTSQATMTTPLQVRVARG